VLPGKILLQFREKGEILAQGRTDQKKRFRSFFGEKFRILERLSIFGKSDEFFHLT
jgi:hypothetical protein